MEVYFDHYGVKSEPSITIYGYEIWAKPLYNKEWAVLLLNNDGYNSQNITVEFSDIPWNANTTYIRDIVNRQNLGNTNDNSYTVNNIPPFGSAFLKLSQTA